LWTVFFCNLFEFYFLLSWLPSFLTQAGWAKAAVGFGTSLLQLGGIAGALPFALLTDRFSVERVLLPVYLLGAVAVAAVGNLHESVAITQFAIALTGAAVVGSQFCLNALAASIYPTDARSTGVGWALGIGRFGAVVSPFIGGAFIAAHWPQERIFALLSVPAVLCAFGVTLLRRARRSIKAQ
jgi:AAHS family 4-hydroxybenzoate transporter-like MFS transporter